jgi:hypothetical protein
MSDTRTTIDYDTIRVWAEVRHGRPATVKMSDDRDEPGILRFDFGQPDEQLEEISWDDFFTKFEEARLALLYQDTTHEGKLSRFCKFANR